MNTDTHNQVGFGHWRKSSFSNPNGNQCVEVAWRKSSFSEPNGNECVEVAFGPAVVGLRDSKAVGPVLSFERCRWVTFLDHVTARHP